MSPRFDLEEEMIFDPHKGIARLDDHLESLDTPGVFVAGDLSGLPLIKNAIRQGARAVERIAATVPCSSVT